jgi:RNA recognition motif-containing protein
MTLQLPYRVRWQDLKDLFRKAGTVLRADVSLGPDNRSRGYGTVLLATAEDAGRAVDMFNGYSWQTRVLEVRPDRLPPDFDSGMSQSMGSANGSVVGQTAAALSRTASSHVSPQSGLVVSDEDPNSLFGLDRSSSSAGSGRNLFVGNLPFHCQWQDLKDLFRQAGTITRADVALGLDGRSRGFGTVVFASESDANRAVKMFNGFEFNGRALKVHHDKFSASALPVVNSSANPALIAPHSSFAFQGTSALGFHISQPFVGGSHLSTEQSNNHFPHTQGSMRYPLDSSVSSGPSSPVYPPELHMQVRHYHTQKFDPQFLQQDQRQSSPPQLSQSNRGSPVDKLTNSIIGMAVSSSGGGSGTSTTRDSPTRARSHSRSPSRSAHPGHISLPPPPSATSFPSPSPHMMSPLHHPLHHVPLTPLGLPPITPSMPPFSFLPQPSPSQPAYPHSFSYGQTRTHTAGLASPTNPATPSAHPHHMLSPGIVMSPGAFWGRPGAISNPFINPAVGAPVHGDLGFFGLESPAEEPAGYFPSMPDAEYFPQVQITDDILRDKEDNGIGWVRNRADAWQQKHTPSPSDTTDAGTSIAQTRPSSSNTSASWKEAADAAEGERKVELAEGEGTVEAQGQETKKHSRTHSMSTARPVSLTLAHRPDSDPAAHTSPVVAPAPSL